MSPAARSRSKGPKRKRRPSPQRLRRLLATEWGLWDRGLVRVAGVDEVGRGPLAGPVLAAAVILPRETWIDGVDDSKRLNADRRLDLYRKILDTALVWGVGAASAREIDRVNIRRATALAMQRAIARLGDVDHLLVDGLSVPELGTETHTAIVGGDGCVHCISAASIVAKVTRDRLMARLAARYPQYGWERNMGYGTPEHLEALDRLGPTPHHRRSFQPCQLDLVNALMAGPAGVGPDPFLES
ncbi:MAG: ribonuclease HII [Gemmatimonadetes bacterium]|nr:ribonuclease HII [Gemmatimonadota bacterium]